MAFELHLFPSLLSVRCILFVYGRVTLRRGAFHRLSSFSKAGLISVIGIGLFTQSLKAQELSNWEDSDSPVTQALSILVDFSRELSAYEVSQSVSGLKQKALSLEKSQIGKNVGGLPIPTAKVVPGDFSKLALQNEKLGGLGGTPYGATAGKSTFGKTSSDLSFKSVAQERSPVSIEPLFRDDSESLDDSEQMSPEQMVALNNQLEELEKEMKQISKKEEPYTDSDYKSYERAKELFKKNDKVISKLSDFDDRFIENAKELFVKHSWRDMDKIGKRPYERFIDRQEYKSLFPYPKGQEPKPKIHREGISH